MGLLGGEANPGIGNITNNNSEFADNGVEVPTADIFGHNIYVGNIATLTINNSYIHDAKVGHEIKSRAHNTTILNSRIYDGPSGTGSYSIDLPNGGNGVIRNNVIEQGPVSENPKIVGFGEEGGVYASSSLTISGNTILNDETSPLLLYNPTTVTAQITGNQFFGLTSTQIASGPNVQSNNQFLASEPALDTTRPWSPEIDNFPSDSNPTITSNGGGATAAISIAENTTAVTTVIATDPDAGQSLGYSIDGGADAALFTINAATGALTFTSAPNFEVPADAGGNNIYDVAVQVADGAGGTDTQAIAVTVTDINEAPTITSNGGGATASVSIAENTSAVTTVVATDPDAGQSLGYSIAGGADAALFTINAVTGAVAFITAPDFETPTDAGTNNIYDLNVQVSDGNGGIDTQAIAVTVQNVTGATINGTNAPETLTGTGEEDFIYGLGGNDTLQGLAGNDTLDGGAGADTMIGGAGNDTYIVDNAGDVVTELAGAGTDTVLTTLNSYTLGSNVENLVYTGAGNFVGTGNALDNSITGGAGNDTLNGGAGADTLIGGTGDDTYVVDNVGDTVSENPGEGTDTVKTVLTSYTLPGAVENLVYTGAWAFAGTGNGLDNRITGGVGADTLNGGVGADTMIGGAGNDTYIVDDAGDVVSENPGGGTDTVRTVLASYTLGSDIENLVYTGAGNFGGTGNGLANSITGGAGNDTLDGGVGADTMIGGLGNDTYIIDNAGDVVTEAGTAGTDTVLTTLNSYTLPAGVEVLTFTGAGDFAGTGNGFANTLTGGTGNDTLNGGIGADTMIGGTGDDTYVVDNVGDAVSENPGEGNDTVLSSITYTLGANLENLTQSGIGNIGATGNAANNVIIGNAGNNVMSGLGGADTLDGGAGTDTATYAASAAGVSVSLATGFGSGGDAEGDTLVNIENLTGSNFSDTLEGNGGNNVLTGGAGTDTVSYQNAAAGITVSLAVAAPQDTVGAGTDTLTGFENLTGSAFDDVLTGSSGANTLMGLDGNDTLNGGAGADILTGGAGADRFVYSATTDSSPGAPDIITDFSHGADIIDLSAIDANASLIGNQAFGFADLNPNVVAHSVTWSESGGNTIIQADVNGDTTADLMLVLTGTNLHLAGSDFIL